LSRVGKLPIKIPEKVEIKIDGNKINVKGPKGELSQEINKNISIKIEDDTLTVQRADDNKYLRSLHGLYRALIYNMIVGVLDGYNRELTIVGIGYKAEMKGKALVLNIGYSHPVVFIPPGGIEFTLKSPTEITVSGIDKELVGNVASKIRNIKPPEPYKGKGIRYKDERVKKKAGKTTG